MNSVAHTPAQLNITLVHLAQALRAMREDCQYNESEMEAINKASIELITCSPEIPGVRSVWKWDGITLLMPSRKARGVRYFVTHDGCTCAAGKRGQVCWHAAAYRLLVRAIEYTLEPVPAALGRVPVAVRPSRFSDAQYADVLAAADDMF